MDERRRRGDEAIGRRAWLAGALAGCLAGWPARGDEPIDPAGDEPCDEEKIRETARQAGLKGVGATRSAHYLAVGDGSEGFRALTLRDCEALARDFLAYYQAQGFEVEPPARRLTVIALADDRSYAAYTGNPRLRRSVKGATLAIVEGQYSRGTNALIVFDHRALGPQLSARAGYENLRTIAHEGTHQLCYNTGLLARLGDTPQAISEGLAMFGEVRPATGSGRSAPGQINKKRLAALPGLKRRGLAWIDAERLLTDDGPMSLKQGPTPLGLLAYAESWLLVHLLMTDPARLPGFRAYLKAVRTRRDPRSRLDDARTHLGDLARLDDDLRVYSRQLLRNLDPA